MFGKKCKGILRQLQLECVSQQQEVIVCTFWSIAPVREYKNKFSKKHKSLWHNGIKDNDNVNNNTTKTRQCQNEKDIDKDNDNESMFLSNIKRKNTAQTLFHWNIYIGFLKSIANHMRDADLPQKQTQIYSTRGILIFISYHYLIFLIKVVIAFSNWWYPCTEPNIQIWYLDKVLVSNEFLWLFIYPCIWLITLLWWWKPRLWEHKSQRHTKTNCSY